MKRILVLLFFVCASAACDKGSGSGSGSNSEAARLIVGEWVYDDPVNGIWEKQKFLSNAKLYYSAYFLNPYVWIENADGTYYFTSGDRKMTLSYANVLGGMTYSDIEIEEIDRYAYTGKFTNSDGSYGGRYEYHRLVDTLSLATGGRATPRYDAVVTDAPIVGYSSNDERIVRVDGSTGEVTAMDNAGIAYVNVHTVRGDAVVEVLVRDPENLIPDYSEALNMDALQVEARWGNYNKEYGNTMRYPIRGNEYAGMAVIWLDDAREVESVQLELKNSTAETEAAVHAFLSSKYAYQDFTDGIYMYFDLSRPDVLPMAVYYCPAENLIEYQKIVSVADLWPDYTREFGKSAAELTEIYGMPFYQSAGSLYFLQTNALVDFVAFSLNSAGVAYGASVFLKEDADWQEALNYLQLKYTYYEKGSDPGKNSFAFIDKGTLAESTVGIVFDGANGCITYVDLRNSGSMASVPMHSGQGIPVPAVARPL